MNRFGILVALALAIAPSLARAQVQQLPDSAFHPTVAAPAFTMRHPRILFDEAHHNFHTLAGRYQAFAALMGADGWRLTPNRVSLSAKTLAGFDVLVIANALGDDPQTGTDSTMARSAFSPAEIEAVRRWVGRGGALLLIADHAPFGSAAAAMSRRFGVEMSRGYTGDSLQATRAGGSQTITNIEFTRARGSLGRHPIMDGQGGKGRIHRVVAFAGQSLLGPPGSTPLMLLSDAAIDFPPGVMQSGRDRDAIRSKAVSAKGRSMAVALRVGKGRVLVQGEAAMLSAQLITVPGRDPYKFGMNQPGLDNQQYALNAMRWLAGR